MEQNLEKILPSIKNISHSRFHIRYHLIFVTKYRRQCLSYIKEDVFKAFRYCESKSNFTIHVMNLESDHIHLIVSFSPTYSIAQTVNRLKQMTTNYLWREKDMWLRQFYWNKKKRLLWTRGYYVGTLGQVSENIVFKYIENQGKKKLI